MSEKERSVKENNSQPEKKNRSTHGASVNLRTNAMGLVSVLLVIGLIATLFFAVSYSGATNFVYFSPSSYLMGLSSGDQLISDNWYLVQFERVSNDPLTPDFRNFKPYVIISGQIFYAKEIVPDIELILHPHLLVFTFTVYAQDFNSEYVNDAHVLHVVDLHLGIGEMPDISIVSDAWSNVPSASDTETGVFLFFSRLGNALKVTGKFMGDSIKYEIRVLDRLMPWNSVSNGNRHWLDDMWNNKEVELGLTE